MYGCMYVCAVCTIGRYVLWRYLLDVFCTLTEFSIFLYVQTIYVLCICIVCILCIGCTESII